MASERRPNLQVRTVLVIDDVSLFLTDSIAGIDCYIAANHKSLSLYPRSHSEHITSVYNLAELRWARYKLSQEKDDLDRSIVRCTEAILLPPVSRSEPSSNLKNVFQLLLHLAEALLERSKFGQLRGVNSSIKCLRYLRRLPLYSFGISRYDVTTLLIAALAIQVDSEDRDGTQDIKEMVVICRELLTSNISTDFAVAAFMSLIVAIEAEFFRGRVHLVDQVIECLRDAAKTVQSHSHLVFFALARILRTRFLITHSNDDYEEAMALLERFLVLNPGSTDIRDRALSLATELAYARSSIFKNPIHSEELISRLRTLLSFSSVDEQARLQFTGILVDQVRERSEHYSLPESLEEANSYASQVVDPASSQSLEESEEYFPILGNVLEPYSMTSMTVIAEKIRHLEEMLSITPSGTDYHKKCLSDLANWYKLKFHRTNDISDIEVSIKYGRLSLDATHSTILRRVPLIYLHFTLLLAFEKTRKSRYLDESIIVGYDILELKSARHIHFYTIQRLVDSLITREQLLGRREDRNEAIRLISMAIDDPYAREPDRFRLACEWAIIARIISHPTTFTAYKSAMSLMQKSLSFAPTVSVQHARLVGMGEDCQIMPLDYASLQIHLGRFEEAVETLEQGRALLWSEMRGLRTPVARLVQDSPLAKRLSEINQELEALTISITPSGKPELEDGAAHGRDGMDPFGRLVVRQQKLVEERDTLVSQIQLEDRPGLEGFLKAPSFTTLRSAASRGPVILINHCRWSSDILIIFHNSLPCSIPTTDDFYDRANKLRDELVGARKHGLDSDEYQDALCSVLKGLYDLIGEPVIRRLRMLGVPEQSRIWLCPTSVFCSLPLHAMGPIPSNDDTSERYFSDLYIPSYTPSLSALIESRKTSPQMLDKPSLLLVAQPDDSLPGVNGEIKVIQGTLKGRVTVKGLVSSEATPSSVLEGLRGSRFAHFACHGVLETGKPFEASFKLHGGERLTLLEIVQSQLPYAEFAFLSCCHTAETTEKSIADEALHLTAAMQYCGFRSVVGTMWEMADTDGRDLAKSFYQSLFSSQEASVPYYEQSSSALRNATRKLRRKRGITLERWVNFVHYGA